MVKFVTNICAIFILYHSTPFFSDHLNSLLVYCIECELQKIETTMTVCCNAGYVVSCYFVVIPLLKLRL